MRVDPACPAEIVPGGLRVPLVEAEMFLALDKAELVPFRRAHDGAFRRQIEQSHRRKSRIGLWISNFTAPQWQDPFWIFILQSPVLRFAG